ncbi:SapB/AmfS family lanthipeptide [Streptomyces sp. NPDC046805]
MALLDLQTLDVPEDDDLGAQSAASKGCGNSALSLLLCV